ncbi:MAG: hypothetical protein ABR549_08560 [Mycobacteriales bacterium]
MYARSTTIQASTSSVDQGITYISDKVMPRVLEMAGCVGMSLLVDRESGRCIATTSWETEQAMQDTRDAVQSLRTEGAQAFGGTIDSVQEWEIALLHREHNTTEGTCVRVSWIKGDPAQADRAIDNFRTSALPKVEELRGFCSGSLMVDRSTGRLVGAFAYDSRDALEASREAANGIRTAMATELNAEVEEVREFELAIAHLRVPELV